MRAVFCGGFVAQWFMAATVRHTGLKSRSCWFFAFSFLSKQVEFHLNLRILIYTHTSYLYVDTIICILLLWKLSTHVRIILQYNHGRHKSNIIIIIEIYT